jgi:hypothetical protein
MDAPTNERIEAGKVLRLAKKDRPAAEALLARLSVDEQLEIFAETPLAKRARALELCPEPEALVPLIPEAELCFTVKAIGIDDASWILAHASSEQLIACADLDVWQGLLPDHSNIRSWLAVYAEAGEETLLRAAQGLDTELWVLFMRHDLLVDLKPGNDEGWQPPEGAQTLDGQFFITARSPDNDLAPHLQLLRTLFQHDYWLYFRMLQGCMWEMDSDTEEWALRWRTGRLEDLGFPSWDDAMRIYGFIRPDQRAQVPDTERTIESGAWHMPVWMPRFPAPSESGHSLFRALAELAPDERQFFYYELISLANMIAVADAQPLGDTDTLPGTLEKAAELASRGLEFIAQEQGLGLPDVLRRAKLEQLFRVGANLDPELARRGRPEAPPE